MNDVQACILKIFNDVKALCDEYNIKYYAIGGTAIGAVRHAGFIPWDDDMDIAIAIEDFDRFIELAESNLSERYEIVSSVTRAHYTCFHIKICDPKTAAIESSIMEYTDLYTGVWLDVMPIAGVPKGKFERAIYFAKLKSFTKLDNYNKRSFSYFETVKSKIAWIVSLPIRAPFKTDYFHEKYMDVLRNNPLNTSVLTGYTWHIGWLPRLIFPSEWFCESVVVPFEDSTIQIPVGWEKYLTQQFGDYMVMPPADQQIKHDALIDLKHSYKDYQKAYYDISGHDAIREMHADYRA